MKRVLTTTLFILNLMMAHGVSAQGNSAQNTVNYGQEGSIDSLKVNFSAHHGANVQEFLKGRALVKEVIGEIMDKGFSPTHLSLDVGITPVKMHEGLAVFKNGTLFVSISIDKDTLERALLNFFNFESVTEDGITFFLHNGSNTEEFHIGMEIVLSVIEKIKENGFIINIDNLEIGISPVELSGENIMTKDGKLYVSTEASLDVLERRLLEYFVWPN